MAGIKISQLPAAAEAKLDAVGPFTQDLGTIKLSLSQIKTLITGANICRVATTANLSADYDNGASGVGATLTNNGMMAALSIDSISLSVGDYVLVKDQSNLFENGLYVVQNAGSVSANWILQRLTDFDTASEIIPGIEVTIWDGTVNALTQWIQTDIVVDVGTDNIQFESTIVAGDGLTKTNNSLAISGIVTGKTDTWGGGGTSHTFTATGLTASHTGAAVLFDCTNIVAIQASPGADTLDVEFSADPGANTILSYIYYLA